ncbi:MULTISPECIES: CotH kinase family protein [Desulfovibrio]|uniref:Chitobiase/beta-hexosaminidase C-terminal domain-containing protein n=1 Tax=Desulfovibrio desulfuricans TaxID=876 RepID=A0AA94HU01_DESDE|nr:MULTISPECIES: CotH kinase family protein [Desulfovibrio]SFW60355.1 Chitobiase/beta-hexosaminidase C-terminal domain-containing protein [Desulfovibrio desulfuricans]SPD34700.1 Spore coat protein CotH [Desulfovibrio sp. G11]
MRATIICLFLAVALACVALSFLLPSGISGSSTPSDRENLREIVGYTIQQEKERIERPVFSPSMHFYTESVQVKISSGRPDARIFYTVDGSRPTRSDTRYTGPITLVPEQGKTCIVVKAVAVIDGQESAVSTHSYFIEPGIRSRYGSYVFSLSTDNENLYGDATGILVPGKLRAESVQRHPEKDTNAHDANYKGRGRNWERPVDVEIFDPDGVRLLSQKAGLRVFGGVSRHYPQKSLRLTARKPYEPAAGKFKYPFFAELAREDAVFPVFSYDSLILSNGGQDLEDAQMRTQLATRIAARAGYPWVAPVHSAAVYLNGAYYGHAYLTTRVDDSLLESFFARPRADFLVLNGGVRILRSSPKYPELLNLRVIQRFKKLADSCGKGPMSDVIYRDLQQQVDVDNLLLYYAIQCYIDNRDWPDDQNNTRMWRYSGHEGGDVPELDGRWRYVLYDLDATALSPWHGAKPPSNPTLERVLATSPLFASLLELPESAAQFANNICDMAFAHYAEDNVRQVMQELNVISLGEIEYAAQHGVYSPPGLQQTIARGRENILTFFRERPEHALNELRRILGYTDLYHVMVKGPARLNTIDRPDPEGWYFVENSVELAATLPPDKAVRHWEVNGQVRRGNKITLSARDAVAGEVRVKLVTEDSPSPLVLEDAYDHGHVCGFSLRNTTDRPFEAQGLYLSDRLGKPQKYALTGMVFTPGEAVPFVGKGARHISALKKMQVNFKPVQGETIYLRNRDGQILSSIRVE